VSGRTQGILQKTLSSNRVALGAQEKVDGRTMESTARYKKVYLPATRQYVSSTRHDRLVAETDDLLSDNSPKSQG